MDGSVRYKMQPSRLIAYKVWISDLINGEYIKETGEWNPNYIFVKNKKVSRVNIIANIVMKYQNEINTYSSIVIDDGSETIRIKAWNQDISLLNNVNIGDTVLVIGRTKSYNNEVYILPEIIKKLENQDWQLLRRLELIKEYGKPAKTEKIAVIEEKSLTQSNSSSIEIAIQDGPVEITSNRQKVLEIISKNEEGIALNEIIKNSIFDSKETENIINQLLKEGEIFESRPGIIRLI